MTQIQSQFVFRAMRPTGAKTIGMRTASDETQLADDLRRDELLLLRAWKLPLMGAPISGMPLKDEASFNEQLAVLLNRGVTLVEALEVAGSVVREDSKLIVTKLREMVAAGESFAGACERVGGFDAVTISVYLAAERTGDLGPAAKRLAISARRRLSIRGKAITVMIYPSVVMSIGVILLFVLLAFVVPMYATQLEQMGGTLNWFSEIVFDFGLWLRAHLGLAGGVALGLIGVLFFMRGAVKQFIAAIIQRLPAVRRLVLTIEMARFFSVMAAMVRSGVPLADALSTSTMVITNPDLRAQLEQLQQGLVEGGLWRTLVEQVQALPLATRKLLVAAERSGDLDEAFDSLSSDMTDEVDVRSSRVLALLEPAALILMFLLVLPLVMAIAIPLLTVRIGT